MGSARRRWRSRRSSCSTARTICSHRYLRRRSRRPLEPPTHYVPSTAEFLSAVRLGFGWGMVPEVQAQPYLASGELVDLDPAGASRIHLVLAAVEAALPFAGSGRGGHPRRSGRAPRARRFGEYGHSGGRPCPVDRSHPSAGCAAGPTIRVTIARGCPATDRGRTDVSNPNAPDLDHQLLPSTAPTAALECAYFGLNGKTFALSSSRKLNGTQAAVAAEHIRALPLGSRGLGAHTCPNDDGRTAIVVFGYVGRADVDIWESTSGCRSTDNSHIVSCDF